MSKPVFIKLTRIDPRSQLEYPVHVNANRILWYDHAGAHGSQLVMNIPDTVLHVRETGHEIAEALSDAPE